MHDPERRALGVAKLVGTMEACAYIGENSERYSKRKGFTPLTDGLRELRQRVALDPLHREKQDAVVIAEVEDLSDVRMPNARGDTRFVQEHSLKNGISGKPRKNRLDCHEPLEAMFPQEARDPYAGHATAADGAQKLIPIQPVARR